VLDAYRSADLVVSAPGGPYFGDLYWRHEPVHWLFAWLGTLVRAPVVLYAPSAGPFRRRPLNVARRSVLGRLDALTVREEHSAAHLRALLRGARDVEVTADAAFQAAPAAMPRAEWFAGRPGLAARVVVVVAAIDGRARRRPGTSGEVHDAALVAALHAVASRAPAHVVLVPQLHGHRADRPYLGRLAASLGAPDDGRLSWEVLDDTHDSDVQRRLVGMADLVVSGRYHPAVFAVAAGVPVVCLAYEHKATGVMEAAGLADLVVPVERADPATLVALVERALADPPREALHAAAGALRTRATRTADLAASLARPPARR
jgi:polysaccharide pyruvyl transferase WcaK-like protein